MIYIDLLHYLNLDKAEQGEKINQLVRELYDKEEARKTLDAQISTIEYWLSEKLLRKPETYTSKITPVLRITLKNWLMTSCLIGQ